MNPEQALTKNSQTTWIQAKKEIQWTGYVSSEEEKFFPVGDRESRKA